jgi:hypothetical protein
VSDVVAPGRPLRRGLDRRARPGDPQARPVTLDGDAGFRPPVRAGDLPVPRAATRACGDHLLQAGFRDGLAAGLFTPDGRLLGFVSLLPDVPARGTTAPWDLVDGLRPLLARALDRLSSLAAAAELTGDALGGAALTRGGRCLPVPGLPFHLLLAPGSGVVAVARAQVGTPGAHASFLSPLAGGLARITVLDCRDDHTDQLSAVVVVRRAGDLEGLDRTDLRVLGALLEGWDAEQIGVGCAVPSVARHVARLAARLDVPSTHALLLHVARAGLYVPPALWGDRGGRSRA